MKNPKKRKKDKSVGPFLSVEGFPFGYFNKSARGPVKNLLARLGKISKRVVVKQGVGRESLSLELIGGIKRESLEKGEPISLEELGRLGRIAAKVDTED